MTVLVFKWGKKLLLISAFPVRTGTRLVDHVFLVGDKSEWILKFILDSKSMWVYIYHPSKTLHAPLFYI